MARNLLQSTIFLTSQKVVFYCVNYFLTIKIGVTSLFLSFHLKLKLKAFLIGHSVTLVTCYEKTCFLTCSPMIGYLFDATIKVISHKNWYNDPPNSF